MNHHCPESIEVDGRTRPCLHLTRYNHQHYTRGRTLGPGQKDLETFTWSGTREVEE